MVIGDRRPYLMALITLDPEEAPVLAEQLGLESSDPAAMAEDEKVRAEVQQAVDEVNSHVGPVEQVKRFAILDHDLSQETGEADSDAQGQAQRRAREVRRSDRRDIRRRSVTSLP